ncbi:hypothetical protein Y032_0078g1207 [Ancylostoma ceylanicum]|uniref:Reverse transcriptase domain-containing protein n=1 Tax=Ancylostoma ceylanicum TaxID=53326 RepID=A0A016TTM3_9BILA|nr:hypothetical protein Y032_0078g1207 [Ancylostoma ceylanicum]
MLRDLPLVTSPYAEVALLDDDIPRDKERSIYVRETDLRHFNETFVNCLNILELIRKLGGDSEQQLSSSIMGYIDVAATLLSGSLHDVIVLRRERVLRSLGLDPLKAMPSYRRLPLAGSTVIHRSNNSVHPELFGRELRDELASRETALSKSVQKLRAQSSRRHRPSPPPKRKRLVNSFLTDSNHENTVPTSGSENSEHACLRSITSNRIAGRLADFEKAWAGITTDPSVLEAVRGYKLPFMMKPHLKVPSTERVSLGQALTTQLEMLLAKGVVEKARPDTPVWISSMFGIPKKDGSVRPIINLKPLNRFLRIPHFKMEGLHLVPDVVSVGDYCAKIDMTDAYFAVNIQEDFRPFLAFRWETDTYQFTCLPFGLATTPYVYTKLMRVVAEKLRSSGIRLISYLDDWAFFSESEAGCKACVNEALRLFGTLGLRVNLDKSVLTPTQRIEFLGLIINTGTGEFEIPPKKLVDIRQSAAALLAKRYVTARELSHFLGKLNFVSTAQPYVTFMTRNLQRDLGAAMEPSLPDPYSGECLLSNQSTTDLKWFLDEVESHARFSFLRFSPDIVIASDASKLGWGAVTCGLRTGGRWLPSESAQHINVLELKACLFGLMSFGRSWRDIDVLLELDNTAAVAYIKRRGGTASPSLSEVAKELWTWASTRGVRIMATHRPGRTNQDADRESSSYAKDSNGALMMRWPEESLISTANHK